MNAPQSLCYSNTAILTQQPNSGGPVAKNDEILRVT